MRDPKEPREFSSMDDSPTNNGWRTEDYSPLSYEGNDIRSEWDDWECDEDIPLEEKNEKPD